MYICYFEKSILVFILVYTTVVSSLESRGGLWERQLDKPWPTVECPTWFVPQSRNGSDVCTCSNSVAGNRVVVLCDQNSNKTLLLLGNCMTFDESRNLTFVGSCSYNNHEAKVHMLYTELPKEVSQLNKFMCKGGGLNRTGLLCGQCEEGLGPAVFSYKLECLSCLENPYGWLLYLFLATFPTTVFFLLVVFFQVRITSASMNAFIFLCQALIASANFKPYSYLNTSHSVKYLTETLFTLYGIWNLDFFRYVLPPFCIGSPIRTRLHVLSLEYIVAIYPLVLIGATYICIELHDRNYKVLVHLSKPLRWCMAHFRSNYDPKASIIHAFSAFLILVYSKLVFVCITLLSPTVVYNNEGSKTFLAVFSDASLPFFGREHLPFALLALFVLLTFVALPLLLLLLYPTRLLQRCLVCCRIRSHALHAFADDFQGFYKGGINGKCDYRYFAGLYLVFRIIWISLCLINSTSYVWFIRVLCPITASLLFALMRPYKKRCFNVLDSTAFALLALIQFWILYDKFVGKLFLQIVYALGVLPLVYIIILMAYKILVKKRHCSYRIAKVVAYVQRITMPEDTEDSDFSINTIPDRLTNPEEYDPLV